MHCSKVVALSVAALTLLSATSATPALSHTHKRSIAVRTQQTQGELAAVKAKLDALRAAVANADVTAMVALWTEDGHYIDDEGGQAIGKAALEKSFADAFKQNGKANVHLPFEVRFPTPDVAIVDGTVKRVIPGTPDGIPVSRYTLTLVKQNGNWLISTGTETPIVGQQTVKPATNPLNDLDWIVGDWKSEKNGSSLKLNAEWVPSKNFIICRYEIDKPGQPHQVATQVIGWDPRAQRPVSWSFDSTGGYGHATWRREAGQWLVASSGVERDGTLTSATNIYKDDANGFTWQSVGRTANGAMMADTQALRIERIRK